MSNLGTKMTLTKEEREVMVETIEALNFLILQLAKANEVGAKQSVKETLVVTSAVSIHNLLLFLEKIREPEDETV